MTYSELVAANKKDIIVQLIQSINDQTLRTTYSFYSNLHADFGIMPELMCGQSFTSKKKARKKVHLYKQATGIKFKLAATDNSLGYTRLIYTLKSNKV